MKRNQSGQIVTVGFMATQAAVLYANVIYMVLTLAVVLAYIPLVKVFPSFHRLDWVLIVPMAVVLVIMLLHLCFSFYRVSFDEKMALGRLLGIRLRCLKAEEIRLLCAVGNGLEDVLFLSALSISELAALQEKRMLRNPLTRHEVGLLKQKPNWEDTFAREYLNYVRRFLFGARAHSKLIMVYMSPQAQYALSELYPNAVYRNYTGIRSQYPSVYDPHDGKAISLRCLSTYPCQLEADGIHITAGKGDTWYLPAQDLRSAVRVDIFKAYERYGAHHTPLLLVSALTEQELSKQVVGLTENEALTAMEAAVAIVRTWSLKQTHCCVLRYTRENEQALQELYPQLVINDISATWLNDRG